MPDMSAITGMIASFRLMGDLTKAAIELRDAQMMQAKIIELQTVIMSAQSGALAAQQDQFSMLERIRALEAEIAQLKKWDAEKEEYEMQEVHPGALAYVLKADAHSPEPPHWLCVHCFNHGRKSVLQDNGRTHNNRESIYRCPDCKSEILVHWSTNPSSLRDKARLSGVALSGLSCPYCQGPTKVVAEIDRSSSGRSNAKIHTLQCLECGRKFDREFSTTVGYRPY